MSASPLRVLEADPDDADVDTDLDAPSPNARTALLQSHRRSRDEPPEPSRHRHYLWVIVISLCSVFVIEIGDFMQRAPLARVLEDIICRKYYESSAPFGNHVALPIPEEDCKMPQVQGPLAMLRGWNAAFSCIPGLLLAVPYGYIADRYGRKLVLVTSLVGATLGLGWVQIFVRLDSYLDIRWFWAGNAFLLLGGGSSVTKAMIYAIFADVTPENQRAAVFFQFNAAATLATMVGVPAAWYLMKSDPLLAMGVGFGFVCAGLCLILFLPETLEQAKLFDALSHPSAGQVSPEEEGLLPPSKAMSIFDIFKGSSFVLEIPVVCLLAVTFFITPILQYSMPLLILLASERYHMSIADASFITPYSSVATFIVLVFILPTVYAILGSRLHLRPVVRDVVVARGSLIFLVLGCLAIAMSPTLEFLIAGLGVLSFGSGYLSAVLSLITSYVHADQVSRLYALIAMIETGGALLSGPVISKAYGWGLDLGGAWSGMAFIVTAGLVLGFGIPIWLIRSPKPEEDVHG